MKRLASLLLRLSVLFLGLSIADEAGPQKFPDDLNVKVRISGDRIYDFDVTVSSPYDTAERYADAFRAQPSPFVHVVLPFGAWLTVSRSVVHFDINRY